MSLIDLFSDTVTKPTQAMRQAMMWAEVGDEQKGEDATTRQLENMIAEMLGFSAALFFPSATMANEIAIQTLCDRGEELMAADNCHLFIAESGGPAIHGQVMCKPIPTTTGIFTAKDMKNHYRHTKNYHYPISKLVSIENTTNMGGGIPWTAEQLKEIVQCADELGLKKHMDGARFFNASVKSGLSPKMIASGFDTITICLSKGLGCPVGALLVFDNKYYEKIRRLKQLMGGAMRQSGIIAAAGIYALQNNITRLQEDHEHALLLAEKLNELPQIHVQNYPPETNMVFFELVTEQSNTQNNEKIISTNFLAKCLEYGFRFSQFGANRFRAVTHLDITREDIHKVIEALKIIFHKD